MRRVVLFVLLSSAAQQSAASTAGTAAGEFLLLGAGARAAGMGGAFTAVADDATALYWNPAGLRSIQGQTAAFMHAPYIASSYYDYAAYARSVGSRAALAAGLQFFSLGSITQTDETGAELGSVSPYGASASFGYAQEIPEDVPILGGGAAGGAAKLIQSKILDTARSAAIDLGLLSMPVTLESLGYSRLQFALVLANAGSGLRYDQESDPLPLTVTVGSRLDLPPGQILALDIKAPKAGAPTVCLGTEYPIATAGPWRFALRGGFDSQTLGSIDGFTGISFGFGIAYRGASMDFAFTPYGGLGSAQRISLNFRWDK